MLHKLSWSLVILMILSSSNAFSRREKLFELVHVCTGHDLLNVIKRACAIHKRNEHDPTQPTHPLSIPLQDVSKVCCETPCRISLFVRLCY